VDMAKNIYDNGNIQTNGSNHSSMFAGIAF